MRRLFPRLLFHHVLVLLAVVAASGVALDRLLLRNEIGSFEEHLTAAALLLAQDVAEGRLADSLQSAVQRRGKATGIRFTVVAQDGVVLADSESAPALMENHASRQEVREALAGRPAAAVRRSATVGVETLYAAVPGPPVVRAALPMTRVREMMRQVRVRVFLAAVTGGLLALGLAYFLARSLSARVESMRRFSRSVAEGRYDAPLAAGGGDELGDMERGLLELRDAIRGQVARLERDRERLAALVEGLPHAVLVFDGDGRMTLANGRAARQLRLSPNDIGRRPAEVLRVPAVLAAFDALAGGGKPPEPFRVPWSEPAANLEVSLMRLPDDQGRPGTLVVLRDVTRELHLERVRTDFVANLSHELRTPLTAIRGSAETLMDSPPADPGAVKKFLETIRRNALRLEALLKDVAELSRVESGAAALEVTSFDGRTPVSAVMDLFTTDAQKGGLSLEAQVPDAPVPLLCDPDKVESILINLVQNGVRYTPPGGRIVVSVEAAQTGVTYTVEDTGMGIPPKDLPRVTERFYRVDPGRSRAMGGTGLGLSIVRHLVECLGGTLEIRSEQGRGTQVRVFVPSTTAQ